MAGSSPEHVDVLIVGAGISGIGGAVHLQERCPGTTFAILEGRRDIGGTWDLFRYPGVRSDSDMHTLGFRFKPWKQEKAMSNPTKIYILIPVNQSNIRKPLVTSKRAEPQAGRFAPSSAKPCKHRS